jgi:CubicO group peptidase (beta-lactamase class C family)
MPARPISPLLRSLFTSSVFIGCLWLTPAPAAAEEVVPECRTPLAEELHALNVPGLAVSIVKQGRLVCASAAGMANFEAHVPVTPDTLFLVASVSKTVTATALMQLLEKGRIGLDDDINDYLPFDVHVPASPDVPVTVRHLLTHTASIADNDVYVNCAGWCNYGSSPIDFVTRGKDSPIPLGRLVREYLTPGGEYYDEKKNFLSATPGTEGDYSNMGIVVAGYLVEVISGMSFDDYCRKNIFDPLAMQHTSWRLADLAPERVAVPYDKRLAAFSPYGHYGEADYPDGMLRTSVTELAHFLGAFMAGGVYDGRRILEAATVSQMVRSQTWVDDGQGLVWYRDYVDGRKIWGHDGSDHGASALMWFDPERAEGIIVMANGVVEDDAWSLRATLFEEADTY